MFAITILLGVAGLVCWVIEIVVAFKKEESPLLGILSIIPCCNLGGLVVGWINVGKWNIMPLMVIWSVIEVVKIYLITAVDQPLIQQWVLQIQNQMGQ
jgi:predicted exporter